MKEGAKENRKRTSISQKIVRGLRKMIATPMIQAFPVHHQYRTHEKRQDGEGETLNHATANSSAQFSEPGSHIGKSGLEKDNDNPVDSEGETKEDFDEEKENQEEVGQEKEKDVESGNASFEFPPTIDTSSPIVCLPPPSQHPVPEIHQIPSQSSECSWLPFYDFFAPLFCLPPSSSDTLVEQEYVVSPKSQATTVTSPSTVVSPIISQDSVSLTPVVLDQPPKPQMSKYADTVLISPHGFPQAFLRDFGESTILRAMEYLDLSAPHYQLKWILQSLKSDVTVHSSSFPGDNTTVVRSAYTVSASLDVVKEVLLAEETMHVLDATLEKFETMENSTDPCAVVRKYMYKAYFPISPRDFVALTTWKKLDDRATLIASSSLPDDMFPPVPGFVRGYVIMSAFYLVSTAENETQVTVINHSNVAANIPAYIVNKAAVSIPIQYAKILRKICETWTKKGSG